MTEPNEIRVKKNKIEALQILRAFAFLCVFTSHTRASSLGAVGVSVFVVLSGFLMYYRYGNSADLPTGLLENFRFSAERIKKIYPLHIVCTLLMMGYIYLNIKMYGIEKLYIYLICLFFNVLLIQSWFPKATIYWSWNPVAWYLSDCVFLYFSFPTVCKLINKIKTKLGCGTLIVTIYGCMFLLGYICSKLTLFDSFSENFVAWFVYTFPLFRLGDFVVGMLVGKMVQNVHLNTSSISKYIMLCVSIIGLGMSVLLYLNSAWIAGEQWFNESLLYLPFSAMLVATAFFVGKVNTCIGKALVKLGDYSATCFLIHGVVTGYYRMLRSNYLPDSIVLETSICFLLTLFFALIWEKCLNCKAEDVRK